MIRSSEISVKQRFLGITVAQARNKLSNEVAFVLGMIKSLSYKLQGIKKLLASQMMVGCHVHVNKYIRCVNRSACACF